MPHTAAKVSAHPPHGPWLIANVLAQISFGLLAMTLCLPSMQEWGEQHAPDGPQANPNKPIDLLTAPIPL